MSTSQITVLKMRQPRPCCATSSAISRLPGGCHVGMLQFNISIPTKLWKVIVDRQARAVADVARSYNNVMLLPVRDIRYLSVSNGALSRLSSHIPTGVYCVQNAVLIKPVLEEEFRSYGLEVSYLTVSFDGPDNFTLGISLRGLIGSGDGRVIFDVGRFPDLLTERPSGALVSYTINIKV